jgi:hypothetical protein
MLAIFGMIIAWNGCDCVSEEKAKQNGPIRSDMAA